MKGSRRSVPARVRRVGWVLASVVVGTSSALAASTAKPLYQDAKAPVAARVEDLLSRMTLEEKIAQITAVWNRKAELLTAAGQFDPVKAKSLYPEGIGHFVRPNDLHGAGDPSPVEKPFRDARQTVALVNAVQTYQLTQTRLGIPALFHEEGLHGYAARGATHFPEALALASTWDPDLLTRVFTVVAREIRSRGVQLVLAPVVDVSRDPRWGRIDETYGEDPYLVGELGVGAVKGFQGSSTPLESGLPTGHVFATLKHMTGHGQPESGTNTGPAEISERVLREEFFPPFIAAIQRAGAADVMPSYNEIDGVPSHANHWLLHDILRNEIGFKGAVVSDYEGIEQLVTLHHVEPDLESAAVRALDAGVDFDMPDGEAYRKLPQALASGRISQTQIDDAVRRMLRMKFQAGLFESPYADAAYAEKITDNAEARALAVETARKSAVLLKNDGTLPLHADRLKTLAVIGPNAAQAQIGGYSNVPAHTVSVLEGIRAKLGNRVNVVTSEGVRITQMGTWFSDNVVLADRNENLRRIDAARQVASAADVIVLVIGTNAAISREAWAADHLGDRADIGLIAQQQELADALFALGKPVVVLLINGPPLSTPELTDKANAILEGWYPGQEGGTALADILFGDANPGGKLPLTIARSISQIPIFYNQKPSAHRGYLFGSKEPLYPFGFGLSYTTFDISAPRLSSSQIKPDGSAAVTVDVRNTGTMAGDEVVQLYIHDVVSSVTRPVKELKGFKRVSLAAGASTTVTFTLDSNSLAFWNKDMKHVVEPGAFEVMAGPDSAHVRTTTLTVTP
ncbi:MAG TPA: glycoside hydrolase family 3 N-terminal domain-containing protein [Steroidobacteraceae bacterium]